jgi:Ca-activated chloride channel family protein
MLVRTFALWSALGMSLASAVAATVPLSRARSTVPEPIAISPEPGSSTTPAHFVDGSTLLLDGRLGHSAVPRSTTGTAASTFLLATVTASDPVSGASSGSSASSHLVIVVDRSGSMAGEKMRNAIAAASGAVDRMRDGDRVTVVAFDTTASLLVPPTTVDPASRSAVQSAIRAMRPGGDTCISCALDRASEVLTASRLGADEVRRILLISDGEPTTGVRDTSGLRALAGRARDEGFAISTIGVDLAFDERVMAAIAQESNGRHWFVPDATALPEVFDQELGSLQASVASDAELTIEPAPGVVIDEVLDRSFRREGGKIVVPLGAFDGGQEKTVLLRASVPADGEGPERVARMSLAYRDVGARKDARCGGTLALEVGGEGADHQELDPFVATRVERSRTEHALLDANELFSKGRASEARAELARRQTELALAAPKAAAAATSLPEPVAGVAGDVGKDFGAQQAALDHAQAGFGAAASAAPAGVPFASTPPARAAIKTNQASASDLGF